MKPHYKEELQKAKQTIIRMQKAIARLVTVTALLHNSNKEGGKDFSAMQKQATEALTENTKLKAKVRELQKQNRSLLKLLKSLNPRQNVNVIQK